MKILLADDEAPARQRLRSLLTELDGHCDIVGEATDGAEALKLWVREKPDLVLLDIRMPVMDGLDVASVLARMEPAPAVVFTTAYDEYALRAFEASALDYLLKPIRKERLREALARAEVLGRGRVAVMDSVRTMSAEMGRRRSHVWALMHGEMVLIPVVDVVYFRADQKYVVVRTVHREVLVDESLKALEEEFGEDFIRIHRNALVALDRVECLMRNAAGALEVKMRDVGEGLEVSRRHAAAVRAALKHFKGSS